MELKLEIGFNQLLNAIRQLPVAKQNQLKAELGQNMLISEKTANSKLQEILLHGGVMTDEESVAYEEVREMLSRWRTT